MTAGDGGDEGDPGNEGPVVHLNPAGDLPIPAPPVERALQALFRQVGVEGGELSITFLEDSEILEMNQAHLGHDWIPDVLSFALHEGEAPVLGDIYIGRDQAGRQAAESGVPVEEEFVRLAVHGALHVLGWDHPEEDREESEHWRIQESVVREAFQP